MEVSLLPLYLLVVSTVKVAVKVKHLIEGEPERWWVRLRSSVIAKPGPEFSYKSRYIVGFGLVEMAISSQSKAYDYRNLYENTGPVLYAFLSSVYTKRRHPMKGRVWSRLFGYTCITIILIHSILHSFCHSFIHLFVYSFVRSFAHLFIHSLIRSFVLSFIHSLIPCFKSRQTHFQHTSLFLKSSLYV